MRPRALDNKINAGVALALIAFLLLSSGLAVCSLFWLQASRSETRAAKINTQLEQLLLLTLDVETGQRGFILTGRPEYLEPYSHAIATLEKAQAELQQLIEDPQQKRSLQELQPLIKRRVQLAQQTVTLRRTQGFASAQRQILSNEGKQAQDQIRAVVGQMQHQQEWLLAQRIRKARQVARLTIIGAIIAMITSPVLVWYQVRIVKQKVLQAKQAEVNLRQANEQLEATNKELEDLTYAASHDLKTPLRGISGLITILQRKIDAKISNSERDLLDKITQDCAYAMRLVDDILLFSQVGRLQEPPKLVNVNELVASVVGHLAPEIKQTQALVRWENLPNVWADEVQLTQIFENLISNALKYRSQKSLPIISISGETTPEEWVFSVRDNGIGIEPAEQRQLFTMFKRLHNQSEYQGTGIGLATVKKIAVRHGGTAWVESQGSGCGSTFLFTLRR